MARQQASPCRHAPHNASQDTTASRRQCARRPHATACVMAAPTGPPLGSVLRRAPHNASQDTTASRRQCARRPHATAAAHAAPTARRQGSVLRRVLRSVPRATTASRRQCARPRAVTGCAAQDITVPLARAQRRRMRARPGRMAQRRVCPQLHVRGCVTVGSTALLAARVRHKSFAPSGHTARLVLVRPSRARAQGVFHWVLLSCLHAVPQRRCPPPQAP